MDDLLKRYENVVCINLVDQKGSEKKLADGFVLFFFFKKF